MATSFQNTHFNPGQTNAKSGINPAKMEEDLAREMARLKMTDEKRQREIEMICAQSDELKELQAKIKNAYLNRERAAQITETQYRKQVEIVSLITLTPDRNTTPTSSATCSFRRRTRIKLTASAMP